MWIAHLSNPHVRPAGCLYKGVLDTNENLAAAVRQINALVPLPDLVVLTGDIVDEGAPSGYAAACAILAELRPRLLVIPGNHDAPGAFRAAFGPLADYPATGPLHFHDTRSGPLQIG